MPYQPTTNFRDSNGVDLGRKLVTKDYLLSVYGSLLDTLAPGLTFTPGLWVWGANSAQGQLGINNLVDISTPVTTFSGGANWKQVTCGEFSTAAIKTDGTLWTWGDGFFGQLGTNEVLDKSTPVTTFAGGTNWKQISLGQDNSAAIKTDGTLWTWGNNAFGQLGDNTIIRRSTPVTTFAGGTNWKQVSCGVGHIVAVKIDGTLWTWGLGTSGQLGDNAATNKSTPVTTFAGGTSWKQVSAGNSHTAAITNNGFLWTWGNNGSGRLGDNTTVTRSTPVTTFAGGSILDGVGWKQVSAGDNYISATKTDGTLWVWGNNLYGQLGDNTTTQKNTPVTTFAGRTNWKTVFCGSNHTLSIKTDGTLWAWGRNTSGQLGINDSSSRQTPVTTFFGGNDWKQVEGDFHTAAIKSIDYI